MHPTGRAAAIRFLDESNQFWAELESGNFEFIPTIITATATVEIELNHVVSQLGSISPPVKGGRWHYPYARELDAASIQKAKDVEKLWVRRDVIMVETHRPFNALVLI